MGYGTWFFFGTWLLIAMAWAFFFLPETKGVSIDQMDLLLYVSHYFLPEPMLTLCSTAAMRATDKAFPSKKTPAGLSLMGRTRRSRANTQRNCSGDRELYFAS